MNWLKQAGEPLFPDVLWSRPENKRYAGKLLIIGGHKQSFNAVSDAYAAALKAGVGTARVILPDSLQKMLVKVFPEAEFAASTPIGSFARPGLAKLLEGAEWADGVLLAGDFGRNSETAILLEGFIEKHAGQLALTGDTLDYFLQDSNKLTDRKSTLLTGDLTRLQKIASPALVQQNADFIKVVEQLSNWASQTELAVVTEHSNQIITAYQQQISTTPVKGSVNMTKLAAYANVWLLQQPEKPFEALTAATWCFTKD